MLAPDGAAVKLLITTILMATLLSTQEALRIINLSRGGHFEVIVVNPTQKTLDISLHLHLMTGLPAEKPLDLLNTARFAISLMPAGVRIHPLIVLKDTQMEEMFRKGEYSPLSLEEAARRTARVLPYFIKSNIPITRFGLFPDEELVKKGSVIAGPFHPAFGSVVWSIYYRYLLAKRIGSAKGAFTVYAPDKIIHHLIGFKRENISHFNSLGIKLTFKKGLRFQVRHSKECFAEDRG